MGLIFGEANVGVNLIDLELFGWRLLLEIHQKRGFDGGVFGIVLDFGIWKRAGTLEVGRISFHIKILILKCYNGLSGFLNIH